MKISNVSFNSKKIAFVDKKKSRSNAWKKRSGGRRKRRKRLKLGFVRKSKGKKKTRKRRSRRRKVRKRRTRWRLWRVWVVGVVGGRRETIQRVGVEEADKVCPVRKERAEELEEALQDMHVGRKFRGLQMEVGASIFFGIKLLKNINIVDKI